jgi:LPS-assembly lipoprotein
MDKASGNYFRVKPYRRHCCVKRLATYVGTLVLSATLSGCSLHPLYAGGSSSSVASVLGEVEIAPVAGKDGWLVVNALRDRLPSSGAPAIYRIEIHLDDQISGFGVRTDDSISRERRTLRARYQLIRIDDNSVLLDAASGSDIGIGIDPSEYSTVAAENTALERLSQIIADQIVTRIALYARNMRAMSVEHTTRRLK